MCALCTNDPVPHPILPPVPTCWYEKLLKIDAASTPDLQKYDGTPLCGICEGRTPQHPHVCPTCQADLDACACCNNPATHEGNYSWLCTNCADQAAYDDHVNRQIDDAQEARYERNH